MSFLSAVIWALMPKSLTGFLFSLCCVYLVYLYRQFKQKYQHIPQLPQWPIIGHFLNFVGNPVLPDGKQVYHRTHSMLVRSQQVFSEQGLTVFFLFLKPLVILFKPAHIEKLLTSQVEIEKGGDYNFLRPWLMNGLLVSKGRKWKARRRMISPAFHFSIIEDFVPIFEECARRLCERLKQQQQDHGKIEHLLVPVERCALEVICQTSIGVSLNSIESGEDGRAALNYSDSLATVTHATFERSLNPFLGMDFIFNLTSLGREYYRHIDKLVKFMDQVVHKRIDQHRQQRMQAKMNPNEGKQQEKPYFYGKLKSKKAFLDLLIETMLLQEDEQQNLPSEQRLDQDGIREEVNTFTFEGFDTTSTTLFSTLYLIGLHPDIQQRAYEEVMEVMGPADHPMDPQALNNLKYLEACIKEALRLFTTVPIISRQLRYDLQLDDGMTIPAKSQVYVSMISMHNSETYYDHPKEYRPERFLEIDSVGQPQSTFAYIPFSAGARNCIGQRFAINDLKVIVAQLLRELRFESLMPLSKIENRMEIVLKPSHAVPIKVHQRDH